MTSQSYATGQGGAGVTTLNYTYNQAGQMTGMSGGRNNATNQPTIYSATPSTMQPGGPQFVTFGNNVTSFAQYDSLNRLAGKWLCGQPGGYNCPNSRYYYGYYAAQSGDKVISETDTVVGDSTTFYYDYVGGLASSSTWGNNNNGIGFSAGYDRYGNRWAETVNHTPSGVGPNQSLPFDTAHNRINDGSATYDAAGNVTVTKVAGVTHSYLYDAENNLVSIDAGSQNAYTYTYDALNQRDKVVSSAGIDRIAFDVLGRRFTTWQDGNAYVKADQYYNDQGPVAFFSGADNIINFEHQSWIGTERMRTDNAGNIQSTFASLPFGEPNATSGSDLDGAHFTGMDEDGPFSATSLGLHHAHLP